MTPLSDRRISKNGADRVPPTVVHVASYQGTCRVRSSAGEVVFERVWVSITDDDTTCRYRSRPPWCGELTGGGADLMAGPWRRDPECVLELDTGDVARARFDSWDRGGQRAQLIGHGPWPITRSDNDGIALDEPRLGSDVRVDARRDPTQAQSSGPASDRP